MNNVLQQAPVKIDRFLPYPKELPPLDSFDEIHCNVSGGNDSTAALLYMLYGYNVPKEKVILFHSRVDGPPENEVFFDWPEFTESHLDYLSRHFDLPLVTAWDEKGFLRRIEDRGMFPDSSARFCTSYLKRDVYLKYARTRSGNILCVTGERHEESSRRAGYPSWSISSATAETKGRYVYNFRPILHLKKFEVRALLKEAGVKEHMAYNYVSRVSCRWCIFASPDEMKAVAELYPAAWQKLKTLEASLGGHTMKYQKGKRIPLCDFIHEDSEFEQLLLR
ncbi:MULTISPECIES: phosphoadenosine phosphosulfate reductase family protein [unclassified Paenibacillus]|uniref:phosphoadenosine phosphosulfate reductase domain-containing protein n=1 Tax=unclassified Paenibacillus TaxID=185978 RepID=UPI0027885702|nr:MULTISPECIES: phosphoadenosine phosphosulfate reductase family protein [unclassified Paenibacillus]MDQ0896412.1 3'-phosphoadenosine 5'-phosphosulfate sulfotransferase (PAPS reductase)/FAD synthetase [Paenibacillus sp. V4I7]MDQ0914044.1 3'-phosphoadenosine 5'-phosphosulfate sulfotransferase (PAPS reductase)/FAD synthetase [Paenibacillus sp. V4I5]